MTTQTLNALAKASSAYLRSAMHQPIYWHEWGEEAFATARRENKPILLDIGAVWCHWCHVMDRESYDDPESALSNAESFAGRSGEFSPKVIDQIVESAMKMFDPRNGGFGTAPKFPHPAALDLLMDQYVYTGDEKLRDAVVTTLEKMAHGGVYDQLAGGFHRYSVDERWVVPHFEKMCYDNSELLKNYVHAYQVTGSEIFAEIARDIVRWMDEWLSDREHGGFYASQDADYSMDDDGDYFTWTLEETKTVLTEEEAEVARLRYEINEIGEMQHNPAKNVLYIRASPEEISKRLNFPLETVCARLESAKQKMYAARLKRPTPYIDKTVYVSWNALCISAYLEAAKVLGLDAARQFALRSLDRILAQGWNPEDGLGHVIAYSDAQAGRTKIPGLLDDYAFAACACLDAYEATSDLSYFNFARSIVDAMIQRFFDSVSGGFFDTEIMANGNSGSLGVLGIRRKPFQDSPTPAGNPVAAIALLRMHAYTNEPSYRDNAERTLEILAGLAGQYGLFAATYGIAAVHLSRPHTQVVVVGNNEVAQDLYRSAVAPFALNKAVIKLTGLENIVSQNLAPALAETIPHLPALSEKTSAEIGRASCRERV